MWAIADKCFLELVLQSFPAGGSRLVHLLVLLLNGDILLVCHAGDAKLPAQLIDILGQTGEHDAGTGTLLVKLFHNFLHVAHAEHVLNTILVHAGVLDMLENHQDSFHSASCVEEISEGIWRNADGFCHVKGVILNRRYHSREGGSGHLHAHTQGVDGRSEGCYLVDGDTALGTDCTDTLHEVRDSRCGSGTGGTQAVNGRADFLHGDSSSGGTVNKTFLHLLTNLVYLARRQCHLQHLGSTFLTHFRQGNHQFVGSLGKALHILLGLQTELTGSNRQVKQTSYCRTGIHLLQVLRQAADLIGGESGGLAHLTHLV